MLRISLAALGIYLSALVGFAQETSDSTSYKNKKLKFDEVNFVSSYYQQDGNNSAVTGGKGTEELTDFATNIDVQFSRYDKKSRKHTLTGELGVDVYTSASSDKIDPFTISSASSTDTRIYPSLTYTIDNEEKGSSWLFNGSLSTEYDYFSTGFSIGWTKQSLDRNREFNARGRVFLDTWHVILPVELRGSVAISGTRPRNSYSLSLTLSQVMTKRLDLLLLTDLAYQTGQLGTLFHRTFFTDGSHRVENLPDTRFKIPVGIRVNYFAGDRYIIRTYYRYYRDNWGVSSHTAELEMPVKITPFFSLSPFYRYYSQKGTRYFAGYEEHTTNEQYYTSDYDLSTFNSNMFGMSLRYAPPGGILSISRFNALELRYGHYSRSNGLGSDIVTLLLKFK